MCIKSLFSTSTVLDVCSSFSLLVLPILQSFSVGSILVLNLYGSHDRIRVPSCKCSHHYRVGGQQMPQVARKHRCAASATSWCPVWIATLSTAQMHILPAWNEVSSISRHASRWQIQRGAVGAGTLPQLLTATPPPLPPSVSPSMPISTCLSPPVHFIRERNVLCIESGSE